LSWGCGSQPPPWPYPIRGGGGWHYIVTSSPRDDEKKGALEPEVKGICKEAAPIIKDQSSHRTILKKIGYSKREAALKKLRKAIARAEESGTGKTEDIPIKCAHDQKGEKSKRPKGEVSTSKGQSNQIMPTKNPH